MQENEFEKKVRTLMDELEISPSAPVWDYVEKRIPKSNRKRRFLAFFLLLAGLSVCGYFFYNKFSGSTNTSSITGVTTRQVTATAENKEDNTATSGDEQTTSENTSSITGDVIASQEETVSKSKAQQSASIPVTEITEPGKQDKENKKENKIDLPVITEKHKPIAAVDVTEPPVKLPAENSTITKDETTAHENASNTANAIIIQEHDTATTAKSSLPDTVQQNNLAKKLPNIHAAKKLQWGIAAFYGKADIVQNIGSIADDKSYSFDGSLNSGGGSGANRNDTALFDSQSKSVKARSAYSFGITVRKPLSSRSHISAAIEFVHINTQIQTGIIKDSTAVFYYNNSQTVTNLENFYRPGTGSTQINKYNLLQIPVWYSYQLNKSKKVPFTVDAGLSLSHIISSSALLYDSYNLAYYKNEDLLRKTQLHILGGFNMEFILRNKSSVMLGPQFQYGLTGIVKNNSSKQHFFMWGLKARYFLKK